MVLIASIGKTEFHRVPVVINTAAAPGAYGSIIDAGWRALRMKALVISHHYDVAQIAISGCPGRLAGGTVAAAYGATLDGCIIYVYQMDGVARVINAEVLAILEG